MYVCTHIKLLRQTNRYVCKYYRKMMAFSLSTGFNEFDICSGDGLEELCSDVSGDRGHTRLYINQIYYARMMTAYPKCVGGSCSFIY